MPLPSQTVDGSQACLAIYFSTALRSCGGVDGNRRFVMFCREIVAPPTPPLLFAKLDDVPL